LPFPDTENPAAALATKGDQMFSMAGVTSYTKEAVLKTTAFEVILEFPPHVIRQHPALGDPLCLAYLT